MYLQLHQAARIVSGIQNRQQADGGMGCSCSLLSERTAPGWDLSNLPNPRVNMGVSSGFTPTPTSQPGCPLLPKTFGLSSPISLAHPQTF